jgi:hypothetical protein
MEQGDVFVIFQDGDYIKCRQEQPESNHEDPYYRYKIKDNKITIQTYNSKLCYNNGNQLVTYNDQTNQEEFKTPTWLIEIDNNNEVKISSILKDLSLQNYSLKHITSPTKKQKDNFSNIEYKLWYYIDALSETQSSSDSAYVSNTSITKDDELKAKQATLEENISRLKAKKLAMKNQLSKFNAQSEEIQSLQNNIRSLEYKIYTLTSKYKHLKQQLAEISNKKNSDINYNILFPLGTSKKESPTTKKEAFIEYRSDSKSEDENSQGNRNIIEYSPKSTIKKTTANIPNNDREQLYEWWQNSGITPPKPTQKTTQPLLPQPNNDNIFDTFYTQPINKEEKIRLTINVTSNNSSQQPKELPGPNDASSLNNSFSSDDSSMDIYHNPRHSDTVNTNTPPLSLHPSSSAGSKYNTYIQNNLPQSPQMNAKYLKTNDAWGDENQSNLNQPTKTLLQLGAENNNHPHSGHRSNNSSKDDQSVATNVHNQPPRTVLQDSSTQSPKAKQTNTSYTNKEKTASIVEKILNKIDKSLSKWQKSKQKVAPNSKETQAGFGNDNNIFIAKYK